MAAHENGFLAKAENREALAMSIDRDALAGVLNADGWTPTTRIVAPGMAGDSGEVGERWQGRSLEDRREVAAARVAKEKSGRDSAVKLRIALPSGPGADLVFARLAEDFTAIGIESQRVGMMAEADLRLIDSVARAPRASWFIGQLACSARKAVCSSGADIIAQKALREADATKRASLYAEAEAELLKTNGFIPLGSPLRWSLLRGDVAGFAPNRWGIHPLMPLASVPK